MSDHSAIQWTDATWNPTTGCTKISPGCAHCYIERTPAFRIAGNRFEHGKTDIQIFHDRLEQPLHWRKPRRVFVNSLSDLFHEDIGDAFIDQVFAAMALSPQHTFQLLTKRAERMRAYLSAPGRHAAIVEAMDMPDWMPAGRRFVRVPENWPLPNVWLGVSVENRRMRDDRVPLLLKTPAAVKFISAEPLLEDIAHDEVFTAYCVSGLDAPPYDDKLDWVIVGGESGPGARPFDVAWARTIITACQQYDVPVFVKQLGARPVVRNVYHATPADGLTAICLHDRKGGDMAEWPSDLRVREFPN